MTKIYCDVPDCMYAIEEKQNRELGKPDLPICSKEYIEINEDGVCLEKLYYV